MSVIEFLLLLFTSTATTAAADTATAAAAAETTIQMIVLRLYLCLCRLYRLRSLSGRFCPAYWYRLHCRRMHRACVDSRAVLFKARH